MKINRKRKCYSNEESSILDGAKIAFDEDITEFGKVVNKT